MAVKDVEDTKDLTNLWIFMREWLGFFVFLFMAVCKWDQTEQKTSHECFVKSYLTESVV